MAQTDPHDPREFNVYAKIDVDGQVLALVELHAPVANPDPDTHVDITALVARRYTPGELDAWIQAHRRPRPAPEPDRG
jgi:hypothetical protein